jgi:ribose transport system permease protein
MAEQATSPPVARPAPSIFGRVARFMSFRNVSVLYLIAGLLILNAFMVPDLFYTSQTLKSLLVQNALPGMVALAVILPLATGAFDLSVGPVVTLGSMGVAILLAQKHVAIVPAMALVILAAAIVGLVNAWLVVRLEVSAIIATLGVGSLVTGLMTWWAGQRITSVSRSYQKIATTEIFGFALPVWFLLIIGVVLWYMLELTPFGRNIYATGGGRAAADLAGVRTRRYMGIALLVSAVLCGFTGLVVTAQISAGSPDVGGSYLLPGYAAAFLGATQLKNGRFNVWGTVLSVYAIAIGVKGFQLNGAQQWITDVFTGAILIFAVVLARVEGLPGLGLLRRMRGNADSAVVEYADDGTAPGVLSSPTGPESTSQNTQGPRPAPAGDEKTRL